MDYEKLYKEALERARNLHKDAIDLDENIRAKQCEIIFPELAESEDEKIRKALIRFHKSSIDIDGIKGEDIIAWLEKQGEQKVSYTTTVETGDGGINALVTRDIEIPYGAKDSELFEESITIPDGYYAHIDDNKVIIKRRGKSKFNVGDWIINRTDATIMQIVNNVDFYESVEIGGQRRTDTYNYVEWDFRLWTIQDAKDGDVLATADWVFIFEKMKSNGKPTCYCHYDIELGFRIDTNSYITTGSEIYPATKEQRELLFQKMKEAGYEWSDKDRKLIKIVK